MQGTASFSEQTPLRDRDHLDEVIVPYEGLLRDYLISDRNMWFETVFDTAIV